MVLRPIDLVICAGARAIFRQLIPDLALIIVANLRAQVWIIQDFHWGASYVIVLKFNLG